jgi:glutathione S-transferase
MIDNFQPQDTRVKHVLYYSPGACSLAPHILLEEIGVPFEARRVNIADYEHHRLEYRAINPRMRLPALSISGTIVTEVPALLYYIASLRHDANFLPASGTVDLAKCGEFVAFLSSTVHVTYAQFRRPERFLPPDFAHGDAVIEQGRKNSIALYHEIERQLSEDGWALGSQYSIVDAYLLPFYLWAPRLGLLMPRDFPRWTRLASRILKRPPVIRAIQRENIEHLVEAAYGEGLAS